MKDGEETMDDVASSGQGDAVERPPCFHCGQPYTSLDADWHIEPVDCEVCPRCRGMPACYTCRNMYCSCEVHQA